MQILFSIIVFGSVVGLVVGLIKPTAFSRYLKSWATRGKIGLIMGSILVASASAANAIGGLPPTPPTPPAPPRMETKVVTEKQTIPFDTQNVDDPTLDKGQTKTNQEGKDGEKTSIYQVTYTDGTETDRKKVSETISTQPVARIIANGTKAPYVAPKAQSNCDPNYSGACVPNVYPSDVDCAGGSGNGPYYVRGPVYVTGTDRYGLDRDGDGVACE